MTAAQLLKEEGIIKHSKYALSLKELDKSLSAYEKTVDKYFAKFGNMLDSKVFKKKTKNKK